MAEAFGIACHELVSLDFRSGSKADSGEARSITNQAVLYGCTPLIAPGVSCADGGLYRHAAPPTRLISAT